MKKNLKSTISIDSVPMPENAVRVALPKEVAYDLRSFQKLQASILDRLGCPNCTSGADIRYEIARHFAIDKKLKLNDQFSGMVIIQG